MDRIFLAGKMAERRKEVAVGRTVDVEGSEKEEAAEVVEGSLHRTKKDEGWRFIGWKVGGWKVCGAAGGG
jgi:hypothetical protein